MPDFITLPDELQDFAGQVLGELRRRGYRVRREPTELQLPSTPTISATRGHETHYFLVRQTVSASEVDPWHRYACSCTADTRVTICCPDGTRRPAKQLRRLQEMGVGLAIIVNERIQFEAQPRDLAFHAQPPDRNAMKPRVRALLGESLDRFERGDWRPAFEDACGILEEECRAYLCRSVKMGRGKYQDGSKIKQPTEAQIRRMPMGALKDIFCALVSQNQMEANLCAALTRLNPDRIRRAHRRRSRSAEAALRRRVGTHFWLINNALSQLV